MPEWKLYKKYTATGEYYNVGRIRSNPRDVEYCMEWTIDRKLAESERYHKNKEAKKNETEQT